MLYPDVAALPQPLQDALTSRAPANIYRMVTHSPGMAIPFLEMADAIFAGNSLPADWRELAILRVGHAYRAPYEIHHHERIARRDGLSEAGIAAAATGSTDGLPAEYVEILSWTDRLLAEHTLTGPDRDHALTVLTVTQLADLVLTVGFYQLVCNFLNTFEVTTASELLAADAS
ncbi:MAG TPA: carboxymuconolactone decarboxylase family protein [Aldersonia sp.]